MVGESNEAVDSDDLARCTKGQEIILETTSRIRDVDCSQRLRFLVNSVNQVPRAGKRQRPSKNTDPPQILSSSIALCIVLG